MTRYTAMMVAALAGIATPALAQGHMGHGDAGTVAGHDEAAGYRSPGLAAALSLTPMPVDFGNLYAENIAWGIAYTSIELSLMAPMFFIAADHGMGHSTTSNPWSSSDRNWMIGLVSGYVVVKVVSGLHAAHNAEDFNHDHSPRFSAAIVPSSGGASALAALRF